MVPDVSRGEINEYASRRESIAKSAIMSRAPFIVLLLTILLFLVRGSVFSASPLVIGAQLVAIGVVFAARFAFARQRFNITAQPADGPLIVRGPYRFIRHPMYAGAMLFVWACILGHWSLFTAGAGVALSVILVFRILLEEQLLRKRYTEFGAYSSRTKRIIPFVF